MVVEGLLGARRVRGFILGEGGGVSYIIFVLWIDLGGASSILIT